MRVNEEATLALERGFIRPRAWRREQRALPPRLVRNQGPGELPAHRLHRRHLEAGWRAPRPSGEAGRMTLRHGRSRVLSRAAFPRDRFLAALRSAERRAPNWPRCPASAPSAYRTFPRAPRGGAT